MSGDGMSTFGLRDAMPLLTTTVEPTPSPGLANWEKGTLRGAGDVVTRLVRAFVPDRSPQS